MSAFPVSLEKADQLAKRMASLGVSESEIDESFVRSGGHGGQNVNKTSTCVMLVHRPTGVSVKCQETRQQGLNRFIARRLLLDKIEQKQKGFVRRNVRRSKKSAARNGNVRAGRRHGCWRTRRINPRRRREGGGRGLGSKPKRCLLVGRCVLSSPCPHPAGRGNSNCAVT